jgi:signal transduction histidine kinase
VTSHVGDAEIREAFFAGADDFISKPPHELELVLRLTRVIRDRELQQKVERQLDDQVRMTRLIAHDINNLLTFTALGIEGMLKVSAPLSPTDSALFERHYKRAALGAERMRELISNVQAVEALEEKGRGLVVSPVELKPLLDECADVFADPLALKDVRLEVVCPPGLAVMAEPLTLSNSVVGNLVSNALKFSFRGGAISLRVREDGDLVELEVRDCGVGMPPDLLERVFLKSEKTSRPGTEQEKGTGFGMPIVKRAMEAFGGSVVIDSVSHQGSDPNGGTRVKLIFRRAN